MLAVYCIFVQYLTHSCHPGNFQLSTTLALQRPFTEKEVNVLPNLETLYKMNICRKNKGFLYSGKFQNKTEKTSRLINIEVHSLLRKIAGRSAHNNIIIIFIYSYEYKIMNIIFIYSYEYNY